MTSHSSDPAKAPRRVSKILPPSRPPCDAETNTQHAPIPKGVLAFQLFAHSPFRSAERMQRAVSGHDFHRVLILRCGGIHAIPADEESLLEHVIKRTRRHRGQVILSEVGGDLLQNLVRAGLVDLIGGANISETFDDALHSAADFTGTPNRP